MVHPGCNAAAFKVNTDSTHWLDFSEFVIGAMYIKLYSMPTSGLLFYGNNVAEVGAVYGVDVLQYHATSSTGFTDFNYTAISQSLESKQCSASLEITQHHDDSASNLAGLWNALNSAVD